MSPSLCIFANFFIDNNERLQRMKDSFHSFKNINPDQWVINIRGRLELKASRFLKKELGNKIKLYHFHSRQGWFFDTKNMIANIKSKYVFIWVEDHILINNCATLKNCILEMEKYKVDQLWYSFFTKEIKKRFSIVPPYKKGKFITISKIDDNACFQIYKRLKTYFYTISMISIMRRDYFIDVIYSSKPYIKRWPRYLPFDFEKRSTDKVFPIIWHALPKKELFASIDDDRGEKNYSLISRGIYKRSISRQNLKEMEFSSLKLKNRIKSIIPKIIIILVSSSMIYLRRLVYTINVFYNK